MAGDQFAVGADQHTDRRDNAREIGLWIEEKRKMSDRPVATTESEFATARRTPGEGDDAVVAESADTSEPHEMLGVDPDADHGVTMQSLSVEDGTGRAVFEPANDASVRSFAEQFQSTYPETTLLASREDERSVQTRQSFQSGLEEELTARRPRCSGPPSSAATSSPRGRATAAMPPPNSTSPSRR